MVNRYKDILFIGFYLIIIGKRKNGQIIYVNDQIILILKFYEII